jgi:hypothetical protein
VGLRVAEALLAEMTMQDIVGPDGNGQDEARLSPVAMQALDIVLALQPETAWPRIEEGAALAGPRFLEGLHGWARHRHERGLQVRWADWPPDLLLRMAQLLYSVYPPEADPPAEGAWVTVTPAFTLRDLRSRVALRLA